MAFLLHNYLELKLKNYLGYLEKYPIFIMCFFFLTSLLLRIWSLSFNKILRDDAVLYIIKALEITQGNFTPIVNSSIGWPFLLGVLFSFISLPSIVDYMFYSQLLSSIIAAGTFFPLYLIAKRYLSFHYIFLMFTFFLFEPYFLFSSLYGLSEPIFTFLFLFTVYFIIKSEDDVRFIYLASIFAALSYYIRLNGIILLLIVLCGYFLIHYKKVHIKHIFLVVLLFVLISMPNLYLRYMEFGSPTYSGENGKYFISDPKYMWSDNIAIPSLFDYLTTHTLFEIYNKFIYGGLFSVSYVTLYKVINPLLLFFFLLACFNAIINKKWRIFLLVVGIWMLSIVPIYHIYHTYRYLFPLIPIFLLLSSKGVSISFENLKYKFVMFFLLFLVFSFVACFTIYNNLQDLPTITPKSDLEFSSWVVNNVQGKIATMPDTDLILLSLNTKDIQILNDLTYATFYSPSRNLTLIKPPYFDTLAEAMPYFKQKNVTHIVIDSTNADRRPYFNEIEDTNPIFLKELYSNYNNLNAKTKIKVFEIDWNKFT